MASFLFLSLYDLSFLLHAMHSDLSVDTDLPISYLTKYKRSRVVEWWVHNI
jgi:hypothetical protein